MPISKAPPPSAAARAAFHHLPVLLEAVLAHVPQMPGLAGQTQLIVDATLGAGGHAEALLREFPEAELFGCDRDPAAVQAATERLQPYAERVLLKACCFSELPGHLAVGSVDFLLADLGVSSPQLDHAERGFSFTQSGALDMRMDPTRGDSAADCVNTASKEQLLEILWQLGEERFAPRIVATILKARAAQPIATTSQLAELVKSAVPGKFHRKGHHPATKTFQAIRMAVNDELGQLEALLEQALPLLKPGGRLAIISFHSLEDRMVKNAFKTWEQPCACPTELPICICNKKPQGRRITRKPVSANAQEAAANPRSRSAKLRVFEKLVPPKQGTGKP